MFRKVLGLAADTAKKTAKSRVLKEAARLHPVAGLVLTARDLKKEETLEVAAGILLELIEKKAAEEGISKAEALTDALGDLMALASDRLGMSPREVMAALGRTMIYKQKPKGDNHA